jgi:hypothetical protein
LRIYPAFVSDDQLAKIGRGLCDRTLPKEQWTHAGHFAATLWLLANRPDLDLPRDLPALIRAYNLHTGGENTDTAGYHETITQASIRAAHRFRADRLDAPLFDCCNSLLRSRLGDPDWLLAHWSRERLFSVAARREWIEPDLEPLPF